MGTVRADNEGSLAEEGLGAGNDDESVESLVELTSPNYATNGAAQPMTRPPSSGGGGQRRPAGSTKAPSIPGTLS